MCLLGAVQGIAELITRPGMINVDFADVKTVMSERGRAMMGSGKATGEDRASQAATAAFACPLLENVNLSGCARHSCQCHGGDRSRHGRVRRGRRGGW